MLWKAAAWERSMTNRTNKQPPPHPLPPRPWPANLPSASCWKAACTFESSQVPEAAGPPTHGAPAAAGVHAPRCLGEAQPERLGARLLACQQSCCMGKRTSLFSARSLTRQWPLSSSALACASASLPAKERLARASCAQVQNRSSAGLCARMQSTIWALAPTSRQGAGDAWLACIMRLHNAPAHRRTAALPWCACTRTDSRSAMGTCTWTRLHLHAWCACTWTHLSIWCASAHVHRPCACAQALRMHAAGMHQPLNTNLTMCAKHDLMSLNARASMSAWKPRASMSVWMPKPRCQPEC